MKTVFIAISLLLSVFNQQVAPQEIIGVASVTDGDTIRIEGYKIRFHGIDTPERQQMCLTSKDTKWSCGQAATNYLSKAVNGKTVSCQKRDVDKYGRIVAVCYIDGQDLNALMVSNGYAIAYRHYSQDYISQEDEARESKKGIWAGKFMEPYKWRKGERLNKVANTLQCNIKGNINSKGIKIFHVPSGQYYSQTMINTSKGEKWFCSEAEAMSAGWLKSKR